MIGVHRRPNPLLHILGRRLVQVQIAAQLVARQAFLGVDDQADRHKPLLQRDFRLLKDRARQDVEAGLAGVAIPAPDPAFLRFPGDPWTGTKGTARLLPPADRL